MKEFIAKKNNISMDIINFLFETFYIYEQRAKVGEYKNIKFEVRTKEQGHNRPHVHASFDNKYSISISIDDKIETIAGKLPSKQETFALKWVEEHIGYLRTEWNNIHVEIKLCMIDSALDLIK